MRFIVTSLILLGFALLLPSVFGVSCNYQLNGDSECAATPQTPYCVSYTCQSVPDATLYCTDPDSNNAYSAATVSYRYRDYSGYFLSGTLSDECLLGNQFVSSCTSGDCKVREVICSDPSTGATDFVYTACPQGCSNGVCIPTCYDNVQNQDETDIDCGGSICSAYRCSTGETCVQNSDCTSGYCNPTGVCATASCSDGIRNQNESDIDCGGSCPRCDNGKTCTSTADCNSSMCLNGVCVSAGLCSNGIKDQNETDVDCGGICPTRCADGEACITSADCNSSYCVAGYCGSPLHCSNGAEDFGETDTDCGGTCPPCMTGRSCDLNADCQSNYCLDGNCSGILTNTCANGVKDLLETDVDCGYTCPGCDENQLCNVNSDCNSGLCLNGTCELEEANPEQVSTAQLLWYIDQWSKTSQGEAAEEMVTDARLLELIAIWRDGLEGEQPN